MPEEVTVVEAKPLSKKKQQQAIAGKKNQALAYTRVLKKLRFVPLERLIVDILPALKPKDQAQILMQLLSFQYPKASSSRPQKKPQKIQVNTQVNVPQSAAPVIPPPELPKVESGKPPLAAREVSLAELMEIASGRRNPKQ